jgi:hypothetical protein
MLSQEQIALANWLGSLSSTATDTQSTKEACWISGLEIGISMAIIDADAAKRLLNMVEAVWSDEQDSPAEIYEHMRMEVAHSMVEQVKIVKELIKEYNA